MFTYCSKRLFVSSTGFGNDPYSPNVRTLACNLGHYHRNHFIILRAYSDWLGSSSGSGSDVGEASSDWRTMERGSKLRIKKYKKTGRSFGCA
jgi:hypothetical protein